MNSSEYLALIRQSLTVSDAFGPIQSAYSAEARAILNLTASDATKRRSRSVPTNQHARSSAHAPRMIVGLGTTL
jgi:hypothetical protein